MALEWNDEYENEEELNKLTGVQLRELYRNAPEDKKTIVAKVASANLVNLETETQKPSVYNVLAEVNVVTDHNNETQGEKLPIDYNKIYTTFSNYIDNREEENNNLVEAINVKSLTEILKISASKLSDEIKNSQNFKNIEAVNTALKSEIETQLKSQTEYSPIVEEHFYNAEMAGGLDDVSQDAKEQFIEFIAQNTGWEKSTKEGIEASDKRLNDNITQLDVYIKDGEQVKLNPIYSECEELASSIKYEFSEDTDEATRQNLTLAYNQQLMANALQRATQDVLRDPSLLGDDNTKEVIQAKFSNLIANNFSRSVVVAGLASSPNTTNGISIDAKTGRAEYKENDEPIDDIENIKSGNIAISPLAVNMDTYQLGIETKRTEEVLKIKKVSKDNVPFFKKALAVGKAAWKKVVKEGGWKKIAVNMAMFGGAAAAMASGSTAVIAAGAAVYAGWTTANAWFSPVWDKLSTEMDQKEIKGFKNRWAYRLKNWKRAKQEKYAEPDFKKRATWRTVEGATIGGVTAALGMGGADSWIKTLARQGTMIIGKSASLTRSWFKRKTATEKLAEQYSVTNYKNLQAAEGYLKQDKVALGAVVGGAIISDVIKLNAENIDISNISNKINELTEKVKETIVPSNIVEEPATLETDTTVIPAEEVPAEEIKPINIDDLDNDHKKMFLNSHKKWENTDINKYIGRFEQQGYHVSGNFNGAFKGTVQEFYNAIQRGDVASCPSDMSAVEYVDRLTRLAQLAPVEHKKGIELMVRDLLCDDYTPSAEDKQVISEALNTIKYEKGSSQCIIYDEAGNPCIKNMSNFGNYFGKQQVATVTLDNGDIMTLPVRTPNVTVVLGAEVNCDNGIGKISSVYIANEIDCGCGPVPVAEPEPEPVIPVKEDANGENMDFDAEKDVILAKEKVSVNMQDPYAEGTAVKSGSGSYYDVGLGSVNGKVVDFDNGVFKVWDKDGVLVTENGFEGLETIGPKGIEVAAHAPFDVTKIVEKLPDTPTNVENGENGSIIYTYEFGKGKDVRVVIDAAKQDNAERVGHFFIGNKEVVIDEKSADSLMAKMSENTNREFTSTDGVEQKLGEHINVKEKIKMRADEYYSNRAEQMANPVAAAENASFIGQKTQTTAVVLTEHQKSGIMSEQSELNCIAIKNGKAILEVKGVEGINRIAVATPTHVEYNLDEHMPKATINEDGSYNVAITTADNKQMLVSIADGKAKTTLDGDAVVLDTQSSKATQNLVNLALRKHNINMNVDLHTDFTEKVVRAVEKMSHSTGSTKTIASTVTQSTR